jgi:hypothetical protein
MYSSPSGRRASVTRPISPTSPGRASTTCSSDPTNGGRPCPRGRWRVRRNKLVHQPHRRHLFGCCPTTSSSPSRRPTSTSYAGPATGTWERALAELQHPGPPCPRPQPGALGRGDRLLLDQSVTRSWSSRLRRRQEDRRHQTPHRRGHPGPAGGRAGHRGQRAGSGGAAPAARPSPLPLPLLGHLRAEQGSTGSVMQAVSRIPRFTIQIVGGIKLKGGFITQPRRWVIERTFA